MSSFAEVLSSTDTAHKHIALFGLSGNPPTGESGHAGIVRYLVQSGQFQEVWVLPVYRHQFFSKALVTFEDRVKLCQLSFEDFSSETCAVRVITIERDVEEVVSRHGTVDTLSYVHQQCPLARLHLILGSDTYDDIAMGRWKQGEL